MFFQVALHHRHFMLPEGISHNEPQPLSFYTAIFRILWSIHWPSTMPGVSSGMFRTLSGYLDLTHLE